MLEAMDKPTTDAIRAEKTLEQFVALNPTSDYEADSAPPRPDQGKVFATRAYEDLIRFEKKR